MYKNNEGYPDPTAGAALKHIEYIEYLKKKSIKTPWHRIPNKTTINHYSCEKNGLKEHYRFRAEP